MLASNVVVVVVVGLVCVVVIFIYQTDKVSLIVSCQMYSCEICFYLTLLNSDRLFFLPCLTLVETELAGRPRIHIESHLSIEE